MDVTDDATFRRALGFDVASIAAHGPADSASPVWPAFLSFEGSTSFEAATDPVPSPRRLHVPTVNEEGTIFRPSEVRPSQDGRGRARRSFDRRGVRPSVRCPPRMPRSWTGPMSAGASYRLDLRTGDRAVDFLRAENGAHER